MPNEWPLFRLDRIFVSSDVFVSRANTRRMRVSDHRAVFADVSLDRPRTGN